MGQLVVVGGVVLVVAAVVLGARDVRARRRGLRGARPVEVFLTGLPEVAGSLVLRVGPDRVLLDDPSTHRRFDLTATGLRLTRRHGDWSATRRDQVTATGRDGRGHRVRLTGDPEDMGALWDALHDRPLPEAPGRAEELDRHSLGGALLLGCAGLVVVLVWLAVLTATPVTGEVTAPADVDGLCRVAWTDAAGGAHVSGVDCFAGEVRGDQVELWALGGPAEGLVWDTQTPSLLTVAALVLALLGVAARGWDLVTRRRRSGRGAAGMREGVEAEEPPEPTEPEGSRAVRLPEPDALTPAVVRDLVTTLGRVRAQRVWTAQDVDAYRESQRWLRWFIRWQRVRGRAGAAGPARPGGSASRASAGGAHVLPYVLELDAAPPGIDTEPTGVVHLFDPTGRPLLSLPAGGRSLTRAGAAGIAHVDGALRPGARVRCRLGDVAPAWTAPLEEFDASLWLEDVRDELQEEPGRRSR